MHAYRNEVLIDVALARGYTDVSWTDEPCQAHKDIAILAGNVLPHAERLAFFFAFGCVEDPERIQDMFRSRLRKDIDLDTIQRYLRRARNTLRSKAPTAKELDNW
jgi:hypothetical protein